MLSTTTDATTQAREVLLAELAEVREDVEPSAPPRGPAAVVDWAASGAMELTGPRFGPPRLPPGAPASWVRAATGLLDVRLPDPPALLGERAACAGRTRQAPVAVGGTFRSLRARDGWFGVSLARASDVELVPALIEAAVVDDPWAEIALWAVGRDVADVVERCRLLGLPGARIPTARRAPCRPAVRVRRGGRRSPIEPERRPLVVDLSSLWAGPLCANLLGLAGARVIKVESSTRPDGARRGPQPFFDLLHSGHESVALHLDRPDGQRALAHLLRRADVVLEASRPRALQQLGICAEEYVATGTGWVAISAYGRDQPDRVGFGDDVAAAAGLVVDDGDGPYPVGDAVADPLAGVTAAAAATFAMRSRRGWLVDVSMRDVAAAVARLPSEEAEVVRRADGWWVESAAGGSPVGPPRSRRPERPARPMGADTERILAEFGVRPEVTR